MGRLMFTNIAVAHVALWHVFVVCAVMSRSAWALSVSSSLCDTLVAVPVANGAPDHDEISPLAAVVAKRRHDSVMAGQNFTLCLAAGVHRLAAPLLLDARDSGLHIIGIGPASISGGVILPTSSPCSDNPAASCVDVSFLGDRVQARHLFVDGQRVSRTRASSAVVVLFGVSALVDDGGYTISAPPPSVLAWANLSAWDQSAIELVFANSRPAPWSESRCTVASVELVQPGDHTHLRVNMKNPCFTILRCVSRVCGDVCLFVCLFVCACIC